MFVLRQEFGVQPQAPQKPTTKSETSNEPIYEISGKSLYNGFITCHSFSIKDYAVYFVYGILFSILHCGRVRSFREAIFLNAEEKWELQQELHSTMRIASAMRNERHSKIYKENRIDVLFPYSRGTPERNAVKTVVRPCSSCDAVLSTFFELGRKLRRVEYHANKS
jgi:hypothetical protein